MSRCFLASCVLVLLAVSSLGCLGGQSSHTRRESEALGDQSRDVPASSSRARDWEKAAQGHGAAGTIPPEELARLEKLSAPGASLPRDAGK